MLYHRKGIQRINNTAQRIIGCPLPSLKHLYSSRCLSRAQNIEKDHSHPGSHLFKLLPSGRRYRCIKSRTNRLKNSFFLRAIITLNTHMHWHLTQSICVLCVSYFSAISTLSAMSSISLFLQCSTALYSSEISSLFVQWFIFSFQIVLFRARSLPHIIAIIILTSCDWLLFTCIYKQLFLC